MYGLYWYRGNFIQAAIFGYDLYKKGDGNVEEIFNPVLRSFHRLMQFLPLMETVWQMAHILKGNGLTRIVIIMLSAVVAAVAHRQVNGILKISKDKECHSSF